MADAEPPPKLCGYVLCVILYLVSCILVWFGYANNAWLIVRDSTSKIEFQRGLNDDCYKITESETSSTIDCHPWGEQSEPFPQPFANLINPGKLLYISTYLARILCFVPLFWLFFSLACCFKKEVDVFSKTRRLIFYHVFGVGGILFVLLALFMIIALFTDSVMTKIPEGYEHSLGLGFFLLVVGGFIPYVLATYFFYQAEFHEILERRFGVRSRHMPVATELPLSGHN